MRRRDGVDGLVLVGCVVAAGYLAISAGAPVRGLVAIVGPPAVLLLAARVLGRQGMLTVVGLGDALRFAWVVVGLTAMLYADVWVGAAWFVGLLIALLALALLLCRVAIDSGPEPAQQLPGCGGGLLCGVAVVWCLVVISELLLG